MAIYKDSEALSSQEAEFLDLLRHHPELKSQVLEILSGGSPLSSQTNAP